MKDLTKHIARITICFIVGGLIITGAAKSSRGEEDEKYIQAALQVSEEIFPNTVLTREELEDELTWFAKVSKPYRGEKIRACYESVPLTMWEEENLVPLFEKITGIKVAIEGISGDETMRKMRLEAETKVGAYDLISIDQDMVGFFTTSGGATDLTELMEKNPDLVSPYLDLEDFTSNMICRNPFTGGLYVLCDYQKPTGTAYRKDWFTNPKYKKEFEEKYGYELKTPMEWFLTATKTGNVEDDWTIRKSLDVAEFFYRPEENMYGTITGTKPGWHLAWFTNDVLDIVFGLGSKAKGPPLKTKPPVCRPYSMTYGALYREGELKGTSVERGGRLNSERGAAMWNYFLYQLPKYASPKTPEIDSVEGYVGFGVGGNAAFNLQHLCFVPTYLGPDSKIKGKFEIAPAPVDERYFEYGMVRGYWDAEGWAITEGSRNKEASLLFAQFTTSKSVSVWKNLYGIMPIRYSTIDSKQMMAHDEEWGGLITLMRNRDFANYCAGTDVMWPGFPDSNEPVATAAAEALGENLSPQETADLIADRLDQFLLDKGFIKE